MKDIRRRKFMQYSAAGIAAAAAVSPNADGLVLADARDSKDDVVTKQVDVLVVGGGTAGTIAAIQAGRASAKTMIVERGTQLGGTTTTGGVSFPGRRLI